MEATGGHSASGDMPEYIKTLAVLSDEEIKMVEQFLDAEKSFRIDCGKGQSNSLVPKKVTKKVAKKNVSGAVAKPKRPLNSWMTFRSYYATIFVQRQQKEISGFMTLMWHEDPFKAKWALLAKSYSDIRDHDDKHVALDNFLALVTPYVGIIGTSQYLSAMGWAFTNSNGELKLVRTFVPDCSAFDATLRFTNTSHQDIIDICFQAGLTTYRGTGASGNAPSTMTMTSRGVSAHQKAANKSTASNNTNPKGQATQLSLPDVTSSITHTDQNGADTNTAQSVAPFTDPVQMDLDAQTWALWNSESLPPFDDQFNPHDEGLGLLWDPNQYDRTLSESMDVNNTADNNFASYVNFYMQDFQRSLDKISTNDHPELFAYAET